MFNNKQKYKIINNVRFQNSITGATNMNGFVGQMYKYD
jgi:hypothetical protein